MHFAFSQCSSVESGRPSSVYADALAALSPPLLPGVLSCEGIAIAPALSTAASDRPMQGRLATCKPSESTRVKKQDSRGAYQTGGPQTELRGARSMPQAGQQQALL